jgi:hypothetical protein
LSLEVVPDLLPRPLDALDGWARHAMELRDTASYRPSGEGVDVALIELQVHLATSDGLERQRAAELLTQVAYHGFVLTTTFGYLHLAQLAAQRAVDAARIAERPGLEAFAMFARAPSVARTGGRRHAVRMLDRALDDAQQLITIRDGETLGAQTFGLLHLMGAHFAARERDAAAAAEREPIGLGILGSKDRITALHFDLARCWAPAEGDRGNEAILHLDTADRIAPTRVRNDALRRDPPDRPTDLYRLRPVPVPPEPPPARRHRQPGPLGDPSEVIRFRVS